jgi:benzoyl-CoA reductase subunit C
MEDKLKHLIQGNSEKNRTQWAMKWKKQGRKVIGVMSGYVPEELIHAAGMLPWRITGTWGESINRARVYRSENSCGYCNHVLEAFLSGELDFLDGVVIGDLDQDLLRLWDVLSALDIKPFCKAIHVPFVKSEENYRFFADETKRFMAKLEEFGGIKITDDSLRASIQTYRTTRSLLLKVYQLRKKEVPPLSGAEALGITTTATVMPREEFNQELDVILPYLETRKVNTPKIHPRLLVVSDMLDDPRYLKLVEEGCLVVMDDMDTGSRLFQHDVDVSQTDTIYALAKAYMTRHGAAFMDSWESQVDQVVQWVKEYRVDGVLALPLAWNYSQKFRWPFFSKRLEEAGIPNVSLDREYHFANVGQLATRIGAFLEMLD